MIIIITQDLFRRSFLPDFQNVFSCTPPTVFLNVIDGILSFDCTHAGNQRAYLVFDILYPA